MALQIYGHPVSTCTQRVLTVLNEKGIDVNFTLVDIFKGEHKATEYVDRLHPFGKVPVLVDHESGIQIFESRAIAQYIATKYRGSGTDLSPPESDLKRYAVYQQALSIELSYFDPLAAVIVWEKIFKAVTGFGSPDEEIVRITLKRLDSVLQGYERVLSQSEHLAGDEVTLADLFHLPYGTLIEEFGFANLLKSYPNVARWWEGLKARKSWKEVNAKSASRS
ncbi:glutathione S-transferase, putative [Talaromyces stipitatus ATCC 10500]|uniref:glutathione transferase n=1 Tax=Talaromyces stipitatus (strain ATCC 10500 / CBS 375.48 / QM 6759 / NRRL 1006) TaxID=441959 RepID=B8M628_TALSN|nr:glutathione S-transferase, putative [Talaromyces stipitatus ATCC 10500]EED19028.1 glutathione S-transferase, putative [Talaromyces stipitatus ATCC 10500]